MNTGSLELTLAWDGTQIVAAEINSTRPPVARALRGLPLARVVEVVPRLFSLCRHAQGAAARLALLAVRGEQAGIDARIDLGLNIASEAIAEHLYHLLISWPQICGERFRSNPWKDLSSWRKRLQGIGDQATAAALGAEFSNWLEEIPPPQFDDAAAVNAVSLLSQIGVAEWASHIDRADFSELPTFAGQPAETGVLARHAGDPEVAALLASGRRVRAPVSYTHLDVYKRQGW